MSVSGRTHSTARVYLLDTPVRTGAKRRYTPRKRGAKVKSNGRRKMAETVVPEFRSRYLRLI